MKCWDFSIGPKPGIHQKQWDWKQTKWREQQITNANVNVSQKSLGLNGLGPDMRPQRTRKGLVRFSFDNPSWSVSHFESIQYCPAGNSENLGMEIAVYMDRPC